MVCNASAGTSINSLKAGSTARVNPTDAIRAWGPRALGHCDMCPASAQTPFFDSSNRPFGGNYRRLQNISEPSCACFAYPLNLKLRHENAERFMVSCSKDYVGMNNKM